MRAVGLSKLWRSQPLYAAVVEVLGRKQGSMLDSELYDALREQYEDLGFIAFNKALMKLELNGKIHVYNVTKNKRGVELVRS